MNQMQSLTPSGSEKEHVLGKKELLRPIPRSTKKVRSAELKWPVRFSKICHGSSSLGTQKIVAHSEVTFFRSNLCH